MKKVFITTLIFHAAFQASYCQQASIREVSYELYLTQIAAAEALIQLNKISEADQYLDACDEKYRDIEWQFLKSALDQSNKTVAQPGGGTIADVKFSHDGKYVAACGSNHIITLYSYPGFQVLKELKGHTAAVTTLDFSDDGKKLASGGRDHTVIIWDTETGLQLAKNDRSFTQGIYQLRFNPDNSLLGVVSWERQKDRAPYIFGFVKVLDGSNAHEISKKETDNHPAAGIVFTPDRLNMIISTWGEVIYSYNITSGKMNWSFDLSDPAEYNAFHSIAINMKDNSIAVGSTDHRVYILDASNGTVLHKIEPWIGHTKIIKAISFSKDGKLLATAGDDQTILVWSTDDFSKKFSLTGHVNAVTALTWSNDTKSLVSSSLDSTIKIWDLTKPFETHYEICDFGPWQTPVLPGRKSFAAPCTDKKLRIYEAATGTVLTDLGMQSGLCADVSKDGKTLVTASFDGIIRAWDIANSREIRTIKGHASRVDGIVYLNVSKQILSVGDSTLRIWPMETNHEPTTLHFGSSPFRIVLSADETFVCIGFSDGKVSIVDTKNWQEKKLMQAKSSIQEIAISPNSSMLAIFSGKNIEIWDTKTGLLLHLLKGHEKAGYGICFSTDGTYLLSGSSDQTFKFWNLSTGACTLTYHGFKSDIYTAKFISQKELLLTTAEGKVCYYIF